MLIAALLLGLVIATMITSYIYLVVVDRLNVRQPFMPVVERPLSERF